MATSWIGDIPQQKIVLGLVLQERDTTAGIARRIDRLFPSTPFARGVVHKSLERLVEKGFLHLVESGPSGRPALDLYEGTSAGEEDFDDWLRSNDLALGVRDVFQCKMTFIKPAELRDFVRCVRELEHAFTELCDTAHARLLRKQRIRRARKREDKSIDFHAELLGIQNKDAVNLMALHVQRLEHLGDELEELLKQISSNKVTE